MNKSAVERMMKSTVVMPAALAALPLLLSFVCCPATLGVEPAAGELKPLFNGKDLTGWVRVNTPEETWSVRDGMLICSGKPIGELRTRRMYQNFVLELEWRHLKPRGNAGVFVWADDITARGVPFHRGIEVQVLENAYGNNRSHTTHGDIFPIHGAKMTPINGRGGSRAFPSESRSKPSPEWNHYRIHCQDGDISLAVNGKVVTRGEAASPRKGYICLESEGGIVHYRNVRIQELPGGPVEKQHVAIADRGYKSIYSGLDLRGWSVGGGDAAAWKANDWVLAHVVGAEDKVDRLQADGERLPDSPAWGFIVDVRLKPDTKRAGIEVNGQQILLVDAGKSAKGLANPGGWNRLEGVIRDGQLRLQANRQSWKPDVQLPSDATQQFALTASGAVDFANVYVRPLK